MKQYDQALQRFTAAEVIAGATDPKRLNAFFHFQVGSTYERKGDVVQAEKSFRQCLTLEPDHAEAMNYLGYMWADRGERLEEARALIEQAVKLEPDNAAYLDSLGWVWFKLGEPGKALAFVKRSVELSPEPDATLLDHLGDIYAALAQPQQAREAWTKSLAIEASDPVRKKLEALPTK
jgi:Flp pilus assembly protein TadD